MTLFVQKCSSFADDGKLPCDILSWCLCFEFYKLFRAVYVLLKNMNRICEEECDIM